MSQAFALCLFAKEGMGFIGLEEALLKIVMVL